MKFLDANVILLYLTRDDEVKALASYALLERTQEGTEDLFTSEAIVAEVVYNLTSHRQGYRLSHEATRDLLVPVLGLRGLRIPQKTACQRALDIFALNALLDFEDALAIAHMEAEGIKEIVSYDRDFDRVAGIVRVEP